MVILLLLALPLQTPAKAPPAAEGTIRITIPDGLAEKPTAHVFRVGDAREEAVLLDQLMTGLETFSDFFIPTLVPYSPLVEGNVWSLKVPAGAYHLRIGGMRAAAWLLNEKVVAGEVRDFTFDSRKFGSVKGSWSIDVSRQDGPKRHIAYKAALVRDGKAWARASGDTNAVEFRCVPPGQYSLVLQDTFERFIWIQDGIKVPEAEEARVAVNVKRSELGGLRLDLSAGGKLLPDVAQKDFMAVDSRNRFAAVPSIWMDSGTGKNAGSSGVLFDGFPLRGEFTLHCFPEGFQPLEKQGLKPRPGVKSGPFGNLEYPALKLALTPLKPATKPSRP